MTLTIWGRKSSSNVQKVLWALDELGMDHVRHDAGGPYGVVDTDAFAAMNPNRRVPVLQEDDFVLWESHAILRYLAARAVRLMPAEARARALAEQWLDFVATTLQPPCTAVFWQKVRLPAHARNAERLKAQLAAQNAALAVLETRLAQAQWLTGDAFGLADIAAGSLMFRIHDMGVMPPGLPGVERWHAALAARPPWQRNVAVSYEELRG